jgi:hypothetical protein
MKHWFVVAAVISVALVAGAVFMIRAFLTGDHVRWDDAYVALDAAETHHSSNASERERLLLANAQAEVEAPAGMPVDRRIHPVGTLVRLRYEILSDSGDIADVVEVRAIVPALPAFGADAPAAPFGATGCPKACQRHLAATQAVQIHRTGQPGLADEWVLRMPVGRAFDLGRQSFTVRDFQSDRSHSIPLSSMRVTMVEACIGRVRAGAVTELEFFPLAILPIPRGLRTHRWVQLEGCTRLAGSPPPPRVTAMPPPDPNSVDETEAPPGKELRRPASASPTASEAIIPYLEGALGRGLLVVDERWLATRAHGQRVQVLRACRFHATTNRWLPVATPVEELEIALPGSPGANPRPPLRVALRLPEGPGLFWVEWTEADLGRPQDLRRHALRIEAGRPPQCPHAARRAAAPDEIVACVPNLGSGDLRAVPDPESYCSAPERTGAIAQ